MKHIKLILLVIYRISLNKWYHKNRVYLLFTGLFVLYFVQHLFSINELFDLLLKEKPISKIYNYFDLFFNSIFLLWIVSPLLFGIKLSPMIDFAQYSFLPVKNIVYALVNNILGFIGIGSFITFISVYALLSHIQDLEWYSNLLISLILLIFINISGLLSFILSNFFLNERYTRAKSLTWSVVFVISVYTLIFGYMEGINIIKYIYRLFPQSLVISGIKGVLEGNIILLIFSMLGLGLSLAFVNYLYLKRFEVGFQNLQEKNFKKQKLSFHRSFYHYTTKLLEFLVPNTKLRTLLTKDISYFAKNRRLFIWNMLQILAAYLFFENLINNFPNTFISMAIMISMLGMMNLSLYMNVYAFDSSGFQNYFIYPISFRWIYLSKNITNLLISLILVCLNLIIAVVSVDFNFSLLHVTILICLYLYSNLISQSFGNIFSIYFVMNVPYNESMGIFNPFASIITSIIVILLTLIPSIVMALLNISENYYLGFAICFFIASLFFYKICLAYASKEIYNRRMILLNELI